MKPMFSWPVIVLSLWLTLGLSSPGRAVVSDHLFSGRIVQGQICDDPNLSTGLAYFMLEVDTDASVSYVDFMAALGQYGVIPADEQTTSAEVDTYHWVDGDVHVWEYWGYFENPATLHNYGDGDYTIVLHYTDGSQEPTTVWYAIPGTDQALPAPTQIPHLLWPPHDGSVASPVPFEWDPVVDPNVGDVYLTVQDENSGEYIISEVYGINDTESSPFGLKEGHYDTELAFESFYSITNPDGIPFDVSKNVTLLQPFDVVTSSVYRFYSPATGRHFYTITEGEKDKLIANYSDVWTFEGPRFYAWSTPYDPALVPVYRFWSGSAHFYTIQEAEKNKLINQYSNVWTYEGVAFYAYAPDSAPTGASPVYRFYKTSDNTHFYTIDPAERDKLINRYSNVYTFEGVAFHAWQ
ncbi:MAG: hypothetical protein M1376_24160 [Planctomycetes bacterium]|nr:hypothetical protein [Planctomycetota bacterium]